MYAGYEYVSTTGNLRFARVTVMFPPMLAGEGDWQLPPTDDDHTGEEVE